MVDRVPPFVFKKNVLGSGKVPNFAVESMVTDASREILSMLPQDNEYKKEIVRRVAQASGVNVASGWSRSTVLALVAAAVVAGLSLDTITHRAWGTYQQLTKPLQLRARVLMFPDGKLELVTIEDRAADPIQLWRVLNRQEISHARAEQIFERPVARAISADGPSVPVASTLAAR
jgi:hypothetical protein